MTLPIAKIVGCAFLLTLNSRAYAHGIHLSHDNHIEGIQSGVYNAGPLGNYAGHLSAAQAISQLHLPEVSEDVEEHDFSNSGGDVESLGTAGDHLEEKHFLADYGGEEGEHNVAAETYEYEEAEHAATQQHEEIAPSSYDGHEYSEKLDIHADYNDYFHNQPIVGIDHGKGAFSYSTLYEHKHDEQQKGYEY